VLFNLEPEAMGVVRSADVMGSNPAVGFGQDDRESPRDASVFYLTLKQRFLFFVEVQHAESFGPAEVRL
jgi:hypothetical protein